MQPAVFFKSLFPRQPVRPHITLTLSAEINIWRSRRELRASEIENRASCFSCSHGFRSWVISAQVWWSSAAVQVYAALDLHWHFNVQLELRHWFIDPSVNWVNQLIRFYHCNLKIFGLLVWKNKTIEHLILGFRKKVFLTFTYQYLCLLNAWLQGGIAVVSVLNCFIRRNLKFRNLLHVSRMFLNDYWHQSDILSVSVSTFTCNNCCIIVLVDHFCRFKLWTNLRKNVWKRAEPEYTFCLNSRLNFSLRIKLWFFQCEVQ